MTAEPASDPYALLERVLEVGPVYSAGEGAFELRTDSRWFKTAPAGSAGAPLIEFRRWPGDSVVALYAVMGQASATSPPRIAGLSAEGLRAVPGGPASAVEWRGALDAPKGARPLVVVERSIADSPTSLVALLVPGDGGLGPGAVDDRLVELRAVWRRLGVRPEAWSAVRAVAPSVTLVPPDAGDPPGEVGEREQPWQVIDGPGFTIGVPPGLRVQRLGGGAAPTGGVAGGRLWLRGRWVDLDGRTVRIGDESRAGYVAEVTEESEAYFEGQTPPLAAPGAERQAHESFDAAAQLTDAVKASAERWTEPGFDGSWFVFRLLFEDRLVEVGLPVVEGAKSTSIYWIPTTWRGPGRAPAPPPVDPAERFGITFERLRPSERREEPWIEGTLRVPGMLFSLPAGWLPAASLRSADGYPVRLVDSKAGATRGTLRRLGADELPAPGPGWSETRKVGGKRAAEVWRHDDGSVLVVSQDGQGYLFTLLEADVATGGPWSRMIDSVQVLRDERP